MSETNPSAKWLRRLLLLLIFLASMFLLMVFGLPLLPRSGRGAQIVAVEVEMTQMQQSMMQFRARFGIDPGSHLTLYEDGSANKGVPHSRALIRRMWPQFDFQSQRDLNGDGDTDDVHHLTGAECLVFFLGGIRDSQGAFAGFSKSRLTPFSIDGQNRNAPSFDFDTDRLSDVDEDGFTEYCDPLSRMPYLYVSGQQGGYRDSDLALYADGDDRNMKHVYRNAVGDGIGEYQIISAGYDADYGEGGPYTDTTDLTGQRRSEADNITNFTNGTLN